MPNRSFTSRLKSLAAIGGKVSTDEGFLYSLVALDIIGLTGMQLIFGFAIGQVLPWLTVLKILGVSLAISWLTGTYRANIPNLVQRTLRFGATLGLVTAVLAFFPAQLGVTSGKIPWIIGPLALFQGLNRWFGSSIERRHNLLQTWLPVASVVYLFSGFVGGASIGAGDGYWYSLMVSDFVQQWRLGIFPAFLGQTEFAFNGAVFPHRFGPLLQHTAALLDLLTFRSLGYLELQNLALLLAGAGGAFSMNLCLRVILPDRTWTRTALSMLYVASPGVLALAYTGGLYMSVMTLPFIPWIALAVWRSFRVVEPLPILSTSAPLAAAWFGHPPIALWSHGVLALALAIRWGRLARTPGRAFREVSLIALTFTLLASFVFVSALTLEKEGAGATVQSLMNTVKASFPGLLLPVSKGAVMVSDYKLGMGIWLVLLAAFTAWVRRPAAGTGYLLAMTLVLQCFLFPIPGLTERLWLALPQLVVDATYLWPMQRLTVIALTMIILATAAVLAARIQSKVTSTWIAAAAWIAVAWSHFEAVRFLNRGVATAVPPAAAVTAMAEHNAMLTRYAFFRFNTVPHYYSHGYVDPLLVHRLLSMDGTTVVNSNLAAVERSVPTRSTTLTGKFDGSQSVQLSPKLTLSEGLRHYLSFEWHSNTPALNGVITADSPTINRLYWVPDSGFGSIYAGANHSFGIGDGHAAGFSAWSTSTAGTTIELRFIYQTPPTTPPATRFLTVHDHAYTADTLPIRIRSLAPLLASVDAPAGGALLETTRMYTDGYEARVNGTEVEVRRTPDHLVAIPLQEGPNEVELRFEGTAAVRAAYWISLISWLGVLGLGARAALSSRRQTAN